MQQKRTLFLLSFGILAAASIPRGVSPEDAKLYIGSAENYFSCLTHPSISIPISSINDDFCDCPDGSDEPGTSACASLPPQNLSIRGFFCRNKHHTSGFLPLSRVNDGICDYDLCCDGSDEYSSVGGVQCENRCREIGAAARKLAEERHRVKSQGSKVCDELVKRAGIMRKEIEDNIKTTKVQIKGMEVKVRNLNEKLKETQLRERNKIVKNPEPGSKVTVAVQLAKERVEEYKSLLGNLKNDRDEAERKLDITESILKTFKDEYNPNFNDEGVKRAVRAWEEYLAAGNGVGEKNAAQDRDLEDIMNEDGIDWEDIEASTVNDDLASIYRFEEYIPAGARNWIHEKLAELRQMMVDNGVLAPPKDTNGESKAVVEARDALKAAEKENEDSRQKLKSHEEDLIKQYGPSDVFRPLKGECINREFGEYRYEYCFLDRAHQISLKDNSRVSLGSFAQIETKDDTSKNEASGVFESGWEEAHQEPLSGMVLKHENGQQCWNGPKRSVHVELYCCAENEIRSVVEMEKCVYQFEVGTPAVCSSEIKSRGQNVKDEL
ncbi:glucosidase II beta subunit-like-domain-containing protein [Geopyxis carbonaria]|nr:glucosidase II beta subunit-like-domain-containing protein [Geopyxis carbonaria]